MKLYLKLLLGWIIVMLILTWTPGEALPKPEFLDINIIEFSAHFGMFLVFSFLLAGYVHYKDESGISKGKIFITVIIISLIFSLVTEGGQLIIPGRYFDVLDMVMNLMGTLIGIWLFFQKIKYFSN